MVSKQESVLEKVQRRETENRLFRWMEQPLFKQVCQWFSQPNAIWNQFGATRTQTSNSFLEASRTPPVLVQVSQDFMKAQHTHDHGLIPCSIDAQHRLQSNKMWPIQYRGRMAYAAQASISMRVYGKHLCALCLKSETLSNPC